MRKIVGLWLVLGILSLPVFATGKVKLLVSVDWEGRVLDEANLDAMNQFRNQFPNVPLLHFLNAAYYTKPGARAAVVTNKISSVLRPGDELGLHIHGWRSLFEAAGVTFRSSPTYWGDALDDCREDCGHEIPIDIYTKEELQRVMHYSVETLNRHGFGRATSFRSGGWLSAPVVLEALAAEGFLIDSSAVPPHLLAPLIGNTPLWQWVNNLWHGTKTTSQPQRMSTPAGTIWEVPDNGALADYMSADDMVKVYMDGAHYAEKTGKDVYVHIGFHQETAKRYVSRVSSALRKIYQFAQINHNEVEVAQLPLAEHLP